MLKHKKKDILIKTLVLIFIVAIYAATGCPVRFLTGICCPGCGMTRAVFSLIRFHFSEAYHFHPLVFFMPFYPIAYLFIRHKNERILQIWLILTIVVFLVVYILRLIKNDPVLTCSFADGYLYQLILKIKGD